MALEQGGLSVCAEVGNASDAVEAALRERPDVCLLDIHMPGGGTAAASMINCHLPDTVVLMLTVSHEGADVFEAFRQGAVGYLLKEMDPAKLPVAVRAALKGEVTLPRSLTGPLVEEFRNGARARRPGRQPTDRPQLTRREWDVLDLLGEGASTAEIAKRLFLSRVTVRRHVSNILNKLDVSTRDEAVKLVQTEEP
jgi:DNA-binding NarL/FixJ family response regulator